MYIIKASGQKEEFSIEKIKRSCLRAGASSQLANEIAQKVFRQVKNGTSTRQISHLVFRYLKKSFPLIATRYSLREAIFKLGPSGFYFEKIVARIFRLNGYEVKTNQIITGFCADHEIDIVAQKEKESILVECKFHHLPGISSELKDVLCLWARFLDLKEGVKIGKCPNFSHPYLITNTKFSQSAIQYAQCQQIKLLGWSWPSEKENLQYFIEKEKLYPLTILRRLEKKYQEKLLHQGFIFCQDLLSYKSQEIQKITNLDARKLKGLIHEAKSLIMSNFPIY